MVIRTGSALDFAFFIQKQNALNISKTLQLVLNIIARKERRPKCPKSRTEKRLISGTNLTQSGPTKAAENRKCTNTAGICYGTRTIAFSREQTAKWQNCGHHETGGNKCELSDHTFGTQGHKRANAKAVLDGQKEESCNASTEA